MSLDEPTGNCNGYYKGKRLFDTKGDLYGILVDGERVSIGDYPEIDVFEIDREIEI